ncbi:unnamed protein product [Callosobruchus maculatus]|uniref:Uncharacterized protein n=1 Tax=Callosobruchus maculatus TaxID=64391 RepID=A0A653D6C4_CALMS|nr:unnamed protein product [Callosobruchus maculatus]
MEMGLLLLMVRTLEESKPLGSRRRIIFVANGCQVKILQITWLGTFGAATAKKEITT